MKKTKQYARTCIDCGKILDYNCRYVRCSACRSKNEEILKKRKIMEDHIKFRKENPTFGMSIGLYNPNEELDAIVSEAEKLGMSYGQYVAKFLYKPQYTFDFKNERYKKMKRF